MSELIFFKLIAFMFSFCFLAVAWLVKKRVGHWLNVSSIFALFWFLYTFLPLLVALPTPINPIGILYILVFTICFSFSVSFFNWKYAFELNELKPDAQDVFDTQLLRFSFYFLAIISVTSQIIGVVQQGDMNILNFFKNPLVFAGEFAGKGYGGELKPSIFAQLGLFTSYFVIVLGGILYGATKLRVVMFVSFLPSLLAMLLQSAKGLFFFSIFIFIAGILVTRIYNKKYFLINISGFRKLFVYGLIVMPVISMSFLSRGLQNVTNMDIIMHRIMRFSISYSSGHLYAFSDWFSERYTGVSNFSYFQEHFTLGFYSLMSFFRIFGDNRIIPLGVYDQYYEHDFHLKTNIFTAFRGAITDFTMLGSLVVAMFIGFLCNFFYYRFLIKRINSFYIIFFIFFVGLSYQSYIISTLMWVTIPVVFLCLVCFMMFYNKFHRVRFKIGK